MKKYLITAVVLAGLAASCGGNESILRSGKETNGEANALTPQSAFAEDLTAMETAGFTWVYVLRRKDGGKIDAEDRSVIRMNTTEANRRVATDEDRAFLIGTNNQIPPEKMTALYARFAIEDRSPPPAANANSNTNRDL